MARVAKGKPRTLGGGRKAWRARLDGPTDRYSRFRVHFKEPVGDADGPWAWTSRSPEENTHDAAMSLFQKTEAWLDGIVDHAPARASVSGERTMKALGKLMLEESARSLEPRTVEGRESFLRAHIDPTIGETPVSKWRITHTRQVIDAASETCGPARLSDLRTVLSVMRGIAHSDGWLDRSIDPLRGLKLAQQQQQHGTGKNYVAIELRPERFMVDAVAAAAARLVDEAYQSFERFPHLGTMYRLAGYGGLRLSEQRALRVWDVFPDRGIVEVNGSWKQPRAKDADPYRGDVKNKRVHDVPLPASVMAELLVICREKLGLDPDAPVQKVLNAQRAERLRRGKLAESPDRWWEVQVGPADEAWLFIDKTTGLPVRSELHNHYWHKVRRWVSEHDPENEWPDSVKYMNMRHHAATFWKNELGREWEDVAAYLGDELTTVMNHYVRKGAKGLEETVAQLASW